MTPLTRAKVKQLVASPTFTSGSLLDVCIVNTCDIVQSLSVWHCDFSPHSFIKVRVRIPKPLVKPTVISARNFNNLNLAALNLDLCNVDWGEVFTASTVENQWAAFVTRFLPIVDNHAPLRKLTIRNPTIRNPSHGS